MLADFTIIRELFAQYWPHLVAVFSICAAAVAATHAAMTKSDVRAAIGWVGIILFSPLIGATLYLIAGINRIRRDQISLEREKSLKHEASTVDEPVKSAQITSCAGQQFVSLRLLGDHISRFPVRADNSIQLLAGGDEAYPAMLEAIGKANRSIALQTYIFDNDDVGREFVEALRAAVERGVKVRVLIDSIGSKYSRPPIVGQLRRHGIDVALFMTNHFGMRMPYANLRSHRKIMVVDGCIGFTGGMNIRASFLSAVAKEKTDKDTHFRIEGPVVTQLMAVFAQDWEFTTRERLSYDAWSCDGWRLPAQGEGVPARCIRSGPDRMLMSTHNMLLGAFAVAQKHIRLQSPYFLPDVSLLDALNTAARRGVQVDIVIPGSNNLKLVNYAMTAQLDQVISSGCRVWSARGNFNHSKLLTIDGGWSYFGSSNIDSRSLRLNFELDIEVYSRDMAKQIGRLIDAEIADARLVTLESLTTMSFGKRLRNKIIWLASPYL